MRRHCEDRAGGDALRARPAGENYRDQANITRAQQAQAARPIRRSISCSACSRDQPYFVCRTPMSFSDSPSIWSNSSSVS
jgi:hypothetical protein